MPLRPLAPSNPSSSRLPPHAPRPRPTANTRTVTLAAHRPSAPSTVEGQARLPIRRRAARTRPVSSLFRPISRPWSSPAPSRTDTSLRGPLIPFTCCRRRSRSGCCGTFNTVSFRVTRHFGVRPSYTHRGTVLVNLTSIGVPLQNRSGARLKRHWTALVQRDAACLQACICVAASNTALATGEFPLTDPSKRFTSPLILDTFHARGETIRLVNEGLSDSTRAASDELIAAVSNLLTIEVRGYCPWSQRIITHWQLFRSRREIRTISRSIWPVSGRWSACATHSPTSLRTFDSRFHGS